MLPKRLRNVFTVGSFTALSRVLGLVREMLQSRLIGAGVAQSAFTLAFAIPNMSRKLFGEGALTAAFVPVFKGALENESLAQAERLARAVMTMVILALAAIVLVAFGGLEAVSRLPSAFGLEETPRLRLTVSLVRTLLPYMVFICGAAFGMGVLNSMGRFKASSFMPCLLNIFWIGTLAVLWFFPGLSREARIQRVAVAILVAGAAQMGFLLWRMRVAGVSPWPSFRGWGEAKVRLVWRNVGIAALGAGAVQVNYMLDQVLAQLANPWAAGVIGYAERLMDLPLGVIGVAFGTVLLPTFAGLFAKGDLAGAREALASSVRSLMFVMLPAAAGLFVLSREITSVIYAGGAFDALATVRVSRALAVYALGLGFFGFQKSIIPWFQGQGDMKTPLRVSVVTVVLNGALNVLAVWLLPLEWRHVGLAGSTVVCAALGSALLLTLAKRRNGDLGLAGICPVLMRTLVASVLMAAAVWGVRGALAGASPVVSLGASVLTGVAAYGALAFAFRLFPRRAARRP